MPCSRSFLTNKVKFVCTVDVRGCFNDGGVEEELVGVEFIGERFNNFVPAGGGVTGKVGEIFDELAEEVFQFGCVG